MSQSVKIAGVLIAIALIYFVVRGVWASNGHTAPEEVGSERFTVVADTISPRTWRDEITVHGHTEAIRKVIVRAETAGVVEDTPAQLGDDVKKGAVLCKLKVDARKAKLAEARAAFAKARLEYDAAVKLSEGGFRSATGVAAAKSSLDLASANVEQANVEIEKTNIKAPFDGVYDHRHVEAGDFLGIGDPCGVVIQQSPFLVTGAVSEKDVGKISKGDKGVATLATGEMIEGVVRFVSASSDPATRTFDVELEVPNEDRQLRDGVTAEFTIHASERSAHHIPRSALTLNDNGAIGIRILSPENEVQFTAVDLLGEDHNGVWVAGLTGEIRLIIRGQEFVKAGQFVDVDGQQPHSAGAGQ